MTLYHELLVFFTAMTLKIRSRSPKSNQYFVMSQLYIHNKFGKNPTTGSQHFVQTRKCDADTNAHADADSDTNRICTKIKMLPTP